MAAQTTPASSQSFYKKPQACKKNNKSDQQRPPKLCQLEKQFKQGKVQLCHILSPIDLNTAKETPALALEKPPKRAESTRKPPGQSPTGLGSK